MYVVFVGSYAILSLGGRQAAAYVSREIPRSLFYVYQLGIQSTLYEYRYIKMNTYAFDIYGIHSSVLELTPFIG